MGIKVAKFGGTSLADAEQFRRVGRIIQEDPCRRLIVVSAPGKRYADDEKVTDMLYCLYRALQNGKDILPIWRCITARYEEISKGLGISPIPPAELAQTYTSFLQEANEDTVASRGEYFSARLLGAYLRFPVIDAKDVIFFDGEENIDEEKTQNALRTALTKHPRAIIPGFYGSDPNGHIKTFRRGGSDITGALVARAVDAEVYENWTDVPGVLMADPRVVKDPLPIPSLSYRELRELSCMGASVLHEDAIFPVRHAGIPIHIKNTNAPTEAGTLILPSAKSYDAAHVITGIAGKKGLSLVTIEKDRMSGEIGFGRRVLEILEEMNIPFEHVPSGVDTMGIVVGSNYLNCAKEKLLSALWEKVHPHSIVIEDGLALLSVVGRGMVKERGIAARVCMAVADQGINIRMIDQGAGEINIILGVDESDLSPAMNAVYREFVKKESKVEL